MHPLRTLILAAAGNDAIRRLVATAPVSRDVVRRFVAGERTADAVRVTREIAASGRWVTLDHLGEDVADEAQADQNVRAYTELLDALHAEGLTARAEVSVKLTAVGQKLDERLALDNASRVCAAAEQCGTTVTLDMEDHTTTESTLRVLRELRRTWPSTGAVLQSYLRRTLADCEALAGSRVRLVKGAYAEPEPVAFDGREVDLNYVRCVNALLSGDGYPMFATHDPRLVRIVAERARWYDRRPGTYEYQMLFGVRQDEQRRLAREGETVRVYVPYGSQWYGYLMRRLAERPANTTFFARALVSHS
ncbi:proline dehydrogenase family protein [Kibdelosporangium phytohabitans]|uniref:proline dehydrogenase n=1 Tax=Kibdelosporangium phytohabitans TaxID=860235 RepID=A0A0N9ICC6_9PSEU|nr:proline dehydrogenase family protein [Kibdelosporangium phytohabitans]ALG14029.1 proline dehydrogenase [Kibdelosporangium phytohabitans]MBE1467013.1 proline dehydrogenase [Kibdelosporangium phytohabitans]